MAITIENGLLIPNLASTSTVTATTKIPVAETGPAFHATVATILGSNLTNMRALTGTASNTLISSNGATLITPSAPLSISEGALSIALANGNNPGTIKNGGNLTLASGQATINATSVTNNMLAGSITSDKIQSVDAAKITGTIDIARLPTTGYSGSIISTGTMSGAYITNTTITEAKLSGTISGAKITDNTITSAKISSTAPIERSKLDVDAKYETVYIQMSGYNQVIEASKEVYFTPPAYMYDSNNTTRTVKAIGARCTGGATTVITFYNGASSLGTRNPSTPGESVVTSDITSGNSLKAKVTTTGTCTGVDVWFVIQ